MKDDGLCKLVSFYMLTRGLGAILVTKQRVYCSLPNNALLLLPTPDVCNEGVIYQDSYVTSYHRDLSIVLRKELYFNFIKLYSTWREQFLVPLPLYHP